MNARRALAAGLIAVAFTTAGCAVGRFIAGAPSARTTTPAQALLVRRCSDCHMTPDPAAMSADAWRAALERMKRRMRLPESEWDSLAAMASHDPHP